MQVKVLQDHGIVRSTKFIDLLTLPLRLTEIGPKVKVSVNGTKNWRNFPFTYSVQSFHLLAKPLW